jgi:uncharacterized DUF497 family protein
MDETIVDFEWDEGKAARNLAKHGITFEVATGVFLDRHRSPKPTAASITTKLASRSSDCPGMDC